MGFGGGYGVVRVGEGWGAWRWWRSLRVWEEELLVECQVLLCDLSLQNDCSYH